MSRFEELRREKRREPRRFELARAYREPSTCADIKTPDHYGPGVYEPFFEPARFAPNWLHAARVARAQAPPLQVRPKEPETVMNYKRTRRLPPPEPLPKRFS